MTTVTSAQANKVLQAALFVAANRTASIFEGFNNLSRNHFGVAGICFKTAKVNGQECRVFYIRTDTN